MISDLSDLAPLIISTVCCRHVIEPKPIHNEEHCLSPGNEFKEMYALLPELFQNSIIAEACSVPANKIAAAFTSDGDVGSAIP